MHIDGDVVLTDSVTGQTISSCQVTKTFAWGGIYGAATTIKDVEEGFAKGVGQWIVETHRASQD